MTSSVEASVSCENTTPSKVDHSWVQPKNDHTTITSLPLLLAHRICLTIPKPDISCVLGSVIKDTVDVLAAECNLLVGSFNVFTYANGDIEISMDMTE
jgi:hypothetical protein